MNFRRRADELFREICALDAAAQRESLEARCGGDLELRREVEALLDADAKLDDATPSAGTAPGQGPGDLTPFEDAATEECGPLSVERTTGQGRPGVTRVGPYHLLEILGEGGMGIVYLAEQREPVHRRVALKLIKPGMESTEVIGRFESERQALALMNHPYIARVYDVGTAEDGRAYFSMEYVQGVPITEFCDRHRLSVRERLELFGQICRGVEHAHHRGIIHRDIKPSNVLVGTLDEKPVVKLIDFGIAKATNQRLTERTIYTEFGRAVGTPAYMSPEQAEMTTEAVDHRTDVYSIGVLLFELLVGEPPLDREVLAKASYDEIVRRIREDDAPLPSTRWSRLNVERTTRLARQRNTDPRGLRSQLRGDLDWISTKALEKERGRRYATAAQFAEDVERFLRGEPVVAGPPGALYRARKVVRKNRTAVLSLSAIVLSLSLGLVGSLWFALESRDNARRATVNLEIARKNAVDNALLAAMSGDRAWSLTSIQAAESVGASAALLSMLRGQVALYGGDVGGAMSHLETAVNLAPESVAARSLLALACVTSDPERYERIMKELKTVSPSVPEDYLFRAEAESLLDPMQSLETLDQLVGQPDSRPIGWLVRAKVRTALATDSGDPDDARLALEDATLAAKLLSGNPIATVRKLEAHLAAAIAYESHGLLARSEEETRNAGREADLLEQFHSLPVARMARAKYFDFIGRYRDEIEELRQMGTEATALLAAVLYQEGRFQEALDYCRRKRRFDESLSPVWSFLEAIVMTGFSDDTAAIRRMFEGASVEGLGGMFFRQTILRLLGAIPEAQTAARELRASTRLPPWRANWYGRMLGYLCGDLSGKELLERAGPSRLNQSEAYYFVGVTQIARGERRDARRSLRASVDSRAVNSAEHYWGRAFLSRLERDSTWPPCHSRLPLKSPGSPR